MNLYLIKIFGLSIVTVCCIIATYTDVKTQIIPNRLTFSTILLGISTVSVYYYLVNDFNFMYYVSIVFIFLLSYILWRLGVWAGGDVKLFTAISTLLIPEFLDVLPYFKWGSVIIPFDLVSCRIPTLLLIFNSVLSIIPVVLIYVTMIITKEKPHLIDRLIKSYNFKEVFITLNSLIIAYTIISRINVYHPIIKIVFLLIFSYIISRIMKYDMILLILTISILFQQYFTGNLIQYVVEFIIITLTLTVKNIYQKRVIKEALSESVKLSELEEGMILQYPLYYKNNEYYFDKSAWYNFKEKGELICSSNARGLNQEEIHLLKEVYGDSTVSIKKGLSFAPFILSGLIITLMFGNTYQLFLLLWGRI